MKLKERNRAAGRRGDLHRGQGDRQVGRTRGAGPARRGGAPVQRHSRRRARDLRVPGLARLAGEREALVWTVMPDRMQELDRTPAAQVERNPDGDLQARGATSSPRDRAARERDVRAQRRDELAASRDDLADAWDSEATTPDGGENLAGRHLRELRARGRAARLHARTDRVQAAHDRKQAARDREDAARAAAPRSP